MKRTYSVLVFMFSMVSTAVWGYSGGTGEPNDPYQIATAEQLCSIGIEPNLLDKCYVLTADIDLDPCLPGLFVFHSPLFSVDSGRHLRSSFNGSFNGNNHVIHNLSMVVTDYGYGFFGVVEKGGVVENLHLENVLIEVFDDAQRDSTGVLASCNEGTIRNCSITGAIASKLNDASHDGYCAALVGTNMGLIENCHTNCQVSGNGASGLIAFNRGILRQSSSQGTVQGDYEASGLALENDGLIQNCTVRGEINGNCVGGLVNENNGQIWYCSVHGSVSGDEVGGLVFNNYGHLNSSFVTAAITGQTTATLVVYNQDYWGDNSLFGTIANCYSIDPRHIDNSRYSGEADEIVHTGAFVYYNDGCIETCYMMTYGVITTDSSPFHRNLGTIRDSYIVGVTNIPRRPYTIREILIDPNSCGDPNSFPGFDFFGRLEDGHRDQWLMSEEGYPILSWQLEDTGIMSVPAVTGLPVDEAQATLLDAGFAVRIVQGDYYHTEVVGQGFAGSDFEGSPLTPYLNALPYWNAGPALDIHESNREFIREIFEDSGVVVGKRDSNVVAFTSPSYVALPGRLIDLVVTPGSYHFDDNTGKGTPADPYQIETPGQLIALSDHSELYTCHFTLLADLDFQNRQFKHALIAGDRDVNARGYQGDAFNGMFAGNGHVIRNVRLEGSKESDLISNHLGLFGKIGPHGMISNLSMIEAVISVPYNAEDIGLLAGMNQGNIQQCSASGCLKCSDRAYNIGGLVGRSEGNITACVADVHVELGIDVPEEVTIFNFSERSLLRSSGFNRGIDLTSNNYKAGGIVGENAGDVINCRTMGSFDIMDPWGSSVGGIVGELNAGEMQNCYTSCQFYREELTDVPDGVIAIMWWGTVGGIVGYITHGGRYTDCYFLCNEEACRDPDQYGGIPLTTEQMQMESSFNNWDFDSVWIMLENDYPRLWWE